MKILILGRGKTGTTAILFKMAGGLPNCKAFSGGDIGKHLGDYENAVYKQTYSERKGRTLDAYREHATEIDYDRKIWMARDPRDAAVSRMLFRWHKGNWAEEAVPKTPRTGPEKGTGSQIHPLSRPFQLYRTR